MNADDPSKDSEQTTGAEIATETNVPPEVSEEAGITAGSDEACGKDPVRELEIEKTEKHGDDRPSPGDTSVAQQEPSISRINEGYQVGELTVSDPHALEGEKLKTTEETGAKEGEPAQRTKSLAGTPPKKV